MKIALYFSDVTRIQNLSSIMRKTSDKSHLGDILQNISPALLKMSRSSKIGEVCEPGIARMSLRRHEESRRS